MKIAFVIPVHAPAHAKFAGSLEQLISPVSDVYVILTTQADLEIWQRHAAVSSAIKILVLTDWVLPEAIHAALKNRSMPTFKKTLGIRRIMRLFNGRENYSYLITCDSEIRIVKPIDQNFVDALPTQFTFIGDHTSVYCQSIITETLKHDPEISDLASPPRPCDKSIYTWWSGMPVYSTESVDNFLDHLGVDKQIRFAESLNFLLFDHLLYQRYVRLRGLHHSRFVCFTHDLEISLGGSLELCDVRSQEIKCAQEAARKEGLETLWVHHRSYEINKQAYILYHLDR